LIVNLDFDARVPVPVSFFPSSYKNDGVPATTTSTHIEAQFNLPHAQQRVGQDQFSSVSASLPPRERYNEEEVHIVREEERYNRPSRREDIYIREERRLVFKFPPFDRPILFFQLRI